jgi:putative PIN family toxin of toxin-antitoxin system
MRTSLFHATTVVLDTNVVVAALLWEGIPRNLLERIAGDSRLTLASSPALMAELTRVLAKQQLRDRVLLSGATTDQLVANYKRLVSIVTPRSVPTVVAGDSDDDHIVALAVAARASLIISGDRAHLLPIGRHEGIAIVTPREAMTLLESQ